MFCMIRQCVGSRYLQHSVSECSECIQGRNDLIQFRVLSIITWKRDRILNLCNAPSYWQVSHGLRWYMEQQYATGRLRFLNKVLVLLYGLVCNKNTFGLRCPCSHLSQIYPRSSDIMDHKPVSGRDWNSWHKPNMILYSNHRATQHGNEPFIYTLPLFFVKFHHIF